MDMRFAALAAALCALSLCGAAQAASSGEYRCVQPVQYAGTVAIPAGPVNGLAEVPIPAGYILHVQYITAGYQARSDEVRTGFAVATTLDGEHVWHPFRGTSHGLGPNYHVLSTQVSLYAQGGENLVFSIDRDDYEHEAEGSFTVSGCLLARDRVAGRP